MTRVEVERQVSGEGLLELSLALGADAAGKNVRVTIELVTPKSKMTQDQWRAGVLATAGGWQGSFERPSQGEPEQREP